MADDVIRLGVEEQISQAIPTATKSVAELREELKRAEKELEQFRQITSQGNLGAAAGVMNQLQDNVAKLTTQLREAEAAAKGAGAAVEHVGHAAPIAEPAPTPKARAKAAHLAPETYDFADQYELADQGASSRAAATLAISKSAKEAEVSFAQLEKAIKGVAVTAAETAPAVERGIAGAGAAAASTVPAFARAEAGGKNLGTGLVRATFAANELKYGLMTLARDLPFMMGAGPHAAIIAGIALAAIAVEHLLPLFKSLAEEINGANATHLKTDVEELTEKVEKLNSAWIKTAQSVHELAVAQKQLKDAQAAEELGKTPGSQFSKAATAYKETVDESGGNFGELVREMERDKYSGPAGKLNLRDNFMESLRSGQIGQEDLSKLHIDPQFLQQGSKGDRWRYFEKVSKNGALEQFMLGKEQAETVGAMKNGDPSQMERMKKYLDANYAKDTKGAFRSKNPRAFQKAYNKMIGDDTEERIAAENERIHGVPTEQDLEDQHNERVAREEDADERQKLQKELLGKKAAAATKALQANYNEAKLGGLKEGDEDNFVASNLMRIGVKDKLAGQIKEQVQAALEKEFDQKLTERAGEKGMTKEQAQKDWREEEADKQQNYQRQLFESRLGIMMQQEQMMKSLYKSPERIAAQDFARKAEGSSIPKSQLEIMRENANLMKQWDAYIKLLGKPPRLGK